MGQSERRTPPPDFWFCLPVAEPQKWPGAASLFWEGRSLSEDTVVVSTVLGIVLVGTMSFSYARKGSLSKGSLSNH